MVHERLHFPTETEAVRQECYIAQQKYLALDKTFGSVSPDTLFDCAEKLGRGETSSELLMAGSATVEGLLMLPRPSEEDLDDWLKLADWAGDCFAAAEELTLLEAGTLHNPSCNPTDMLRAQLQGLFIDLYKDLLSGHISHHTTTQLRCELDRLAAYTAKSLDYELKEKNENFEYVLGFAFELASLIALNRDHQQDRVALPATVRADSGDHSPEVSHDLILARPSTWGLTDMEGFQLKGRVKGDDASRYDTSQITLVDAFYDLGLNNDALKVAFGPYGTGRNELLDHIDTTLSSAYLMQHP